MEKIKPYQVGRIIVRAPTWVGDAVMSVPALRRLRDLLPGSNITVAANSATADIFREARFVDSVLILEPGFIPAIGQLRHGKFDLALLFQNAFFAAAVAFVARVPFRIGYAADRRGWLLTTSVPVPVWKNERHESFYYLNLVSELAAMITRSPIVSDARPEFDLAVSVERQVAARRLLAQNGAAPDKPIAVLCPGSVNSRAKRWPAERYAELGDRLAEAGMQVVVIGSPGEIDVSQTLLIHAKYAPVVLTGQTTVADAVALLSIANVLVTNDTGPAHIGAALGTPTLVIFGPTNPLTTFPMSRRAELIRQPPDCAPCMLRDCPIDHRCMTAISVEEVFRRAMSVQESKPAQLIGC